MARPPPPERLIADLVVDAGLATAEQVASCLESRRKMAARGVKPLPTLGEMLAARGVVAQYRRARPVVPRTR